MGKTYVFYNPLAGNGQGGKRLGYLDTQIEGEKVMFDMTGDKSYEELLPEMGEDDTIILCGGDGTLNRFINDAPEALFDRKILYYPNGSGNDFAHDLGYRGGDVLYPLNEYIKDLPVVEIDGRIHRFLNGVGYGIDGYCCEEGDRLRAAAQQKINYTSIAIKGLLFYYKPKNVTVTVDGISHRYKKVWLTPVMNGRFYGGGMIPTPDQDRLNEERTLSVMVFHGCSKFRVLSIFPSIFKGEHVKHKKQVEILVGKEIVVEYDRPAPAQIDGETVSGVTRVTVRSASLIPEVQAEATV